MTTNFDNRVYIDTNILINNFIYKKRKKAESKTAYSALNYLFSHPHIKCYIASFSIIQFLSTLSRAKYNQTDISEEIKYILSKFEVIDFTSADIENSLNINANDLEDSFQYTVSQKLKCRYIITDNIKDFKLYLRVSPVNSKNIRKIVFSK